MNEIKPGDVVHLKSGGPPMTVESVGVYSDGEKAKCSWFWNNKQETALYAVAALELVK